jgi:hypothetical protein
MEKTTMEQPSLTTQLAGLADVLSTSHPQAPALLRWAILHIESQDEALAEARQELAAEEAERLRLENAAHQAQQLMEQALQAIRYGQRADIEIVRDIAGHINIMAGHGDPDYLKKSGESIRHIDLREKPPRKKKSDKGN